jgi:proteasome lid subunit RPN8/RPN11
VRFAYDMIEVIRHQVGSAGRETEAGGLLFGRDEFVIGAFTARNTAADPRAEFAVDPEVMDQVLLNEEARGSELLGTYHSHPNGNAQMSSADAAMARQTGALLIIGLGRPWEWRLWDPVAGGEVDFVIAPPFGRAMGRLTAAL